MRERQVFTTDCLSPHESLKAWRDYLADVYYKLDVFPKNSDHVRGALVRRAFASTGVSRFRADAQRVVRSRDMARDDLVENYAFVFPTNGIFTYRQRGNEGIATVGQAYVVNTSEHYEVDLSDNASMVAFVVPCDLARGQIYGLDDLCSKSSFADPLMISALSNLANNALDLDTQLSSDQIQSLMFSLLDMSILSRWKPVDHWKYSDGIDDFLVDAIRRNIREGISNPSLTLADVASQCRVSARRLQYALKNRNSTFSRELMEARLLRAARLLKSRSQSITSIGEIAATCGFASQSHFATRYRERFGVSPRDARKANQTP